MERVMVFVDGWNLSVGFKDYLTSLDLPADDYRIDFEKLPMELAGQDRGLAYTHYYIGAVSQQDNRQRYASQQSFFSRLRQFPRFDLHEGRLVPRTRLVACPHCRKQFEERFRVEKGSDIQIAADVLFGAFFDQYDTAIMLTNDTDFIHVVKQVQQLRKKAQNAEFENRSQESRLARECDPPCIVLNTDFLKNCTFRKDRKPLGW